MALTYPYLFSDMLTTKKKREEMYITFE